VRKVVYCIFDIPMIKNKKSQVIFLLISVYALLMLQEIVLTQVVCYKQNGQANLEMATFGLKCNCIQGHPDHASSNSCFECKTDSCVDQPLDNSWLERITNPTISKTDLVKQFNITIQNLNRSGEIQNQVLESLLLISITKAPPIISNQNDNAVLRC
jgi:hypothetical protein